ncbi:Uncharacterised protein [Legionella wadsworthii]|uniref:Uncharacterized protein n=1 Tax=Legionella wadsworthii TaxID=28088 RepID=A0A378LT93_9GAMM|nr:Uncharacterised protein [Legionella wadsworthii]
MRQLTLESKIHPGMMEFWLYAIKNFFNSIDYSIGDFVGDNREFGEEFNTKDMYH